MKKEIPGRILITLIGIAFILWGLNDLALGVWGEEVTAVITTVRRQGGERADARPGRYTYQIAYRFTSKDGRQIDGTFTKIGSALYRKADGTETITVRYFPIAPFLNAPEQGTKFSLRQPILIGAGCLLLVTVNRRTSRRTSRIKKADDC